MNVPGAAQILLIEDDPALADVLAEVLRMEGYQVLHAADG